MFPYGIVVKQNRSVFQQSLILWQKKYGILKMSKFIVSAILPVLLFFVSYVAVSIFVDKEEMLSTLLVTSVFYCFFIGLFLYLTAMRAVRDFARTNDKKLQIVLKDETLEVTTEFTKEVFPYSEIELCYEKNFLLTIICDSKSLPVAVSKVQVEKGNYDMFVSLLKSKVPGRYEKRGEN